MDARYLSEAREGVFPGLRKGDYHVTSAEDPDYNCIAHAADKTDAPWWPVAEGTEGVFWPKGVDRKETLACFIAAYATEGYSPCDSPEPEDGFEKVALYVDAAGVPTHAAKQLPWGSWTSKLGDWEDIEHKRLASLEGGSDHSAYGKVAQVLKRPRPQPSDASREHSAGRAGP
jgi:hypothetical protein